MITCPKCFKENQDHYKFCLGCGAELPRDASPKKFAPGTPPHGVAAVKAGAAGAAGSPALVDEVTAEAVEQEREDARVAEQVAAGHPVDGLFPPNAEWKARFREQDGA